MKTFETVDISGDAGIKAYGQTVEEVFVNSAVGMYNLITDLNGIREEKEVPVDVESHSLEGLIVSWLNELIFLFDTFGFIGKKINIKTFGKNRVTAGVCGEDFDPDRHEKRLLIKAATYHKLSIAKENGLWVAKVIFDI
jgi:SHS2 domain-containing protein